MNKKLILFVSLGILGLTGLALGGYLLFKKQLIPGKELLVDKGPFVTDAKGLDVKPTLGEKKKTNLIEKTGGTLALEGEKGKFNLSFPDKTFSEKQDVTLQEINTITGMGDGAELLAGVSAKPDGTTLFQNSELSFDIPTTGKNLMAFSYNEDGKDFHLIPLYIKNGKPTIYLSHFSGYGIINVGDGSYSPPTPNAIDAQAAQLIAKIVGEAKKRQMEGDSNSLTENELTRIYNLLNVWYKLRVKVDLEKAVNNEDLIEEAFNKYNTWKAGVMMVGLTDKFSTEIEDSYNTAAKAVKNAYEKAGKKCTENKDATQIAKMTRWAAFAQYWGLNGRSGLNTDDLIEKTKKCAVFELTIDSTYTLPSVNVSTSASGSIPIGMDSNYNLTGSGSIQQQSWTQEGFACRYQEGSHPKFPADIVSTKLTANQKEQKVSLIMQLDEPENNLLCESKTVDLTSSSGNDNWMSDYFVINYDETYIDPGKFVISDWEIVNSGGVYAKKTVSRTKTINLSIASYAITEKTTYQLLHKPR